jgi:hypothetical protein
MKRTIICGQSNHDIGEEEFYQWDENGNESVVVKPWCFTHDEDPHFEDDSAVQAEMKLWELLR